MPINYSMEYHKATGLPCPRLCFDTHRALYCQSPSPHILEHLQLLATFRLVWLSLGSTQVPESADYL